ncbi:hypothetical protein COOONC_27278 [Cooperia oncophora]
MLIRKTVNYTTILSQSFPKRSRSTPLHITEQLAKAISNLAIASCLAIVIGDFNILETDWAQRNSNRENSHPLAETFAYHAFSHLVKEPTRGDNILDLVLTNDQQQMISTSLTIYQLILLLGMMTASLPPCVPLFKRLFHKWDYSRALSYLSSILWVFETLSTVDDKYSMFLFTLNHTIDQYVPWALVYPNKRNLPEYLRNMPEHKECLFQYAELTGD